MHTNKFSGQWRKWAGIAIICWRFPMTSNGDVITLTIPGVFLAPNSATNTINVYATDSTKSLAVSNMVLNISVAAIGVSGSSVENDHTVATAGAEAIR